MNKNIKLGGCVLAGGKSTRAQGLAKEKFVLNEKTFLERILQVLQSMPECCVSYNKESSMIQDEIAGCNAYRAEQGLALVDIVPDLPEVCGKGPIGGLYTVLKRTTCDGILFCPCDVPFFGQHVYDALVANYNDKNTPVIMKINNKIQPLCGIYPKSSLQSMEKCLQENVYKIRCILDQLPTVYLNAEDYGLTEQDFWNVNTLSELEDIKAWNSKNNRNPSL